MLLARELFLEREYVTFTVGWFPWVVIPVCVLTGIYSVGKATFYILKCILTVVFGKKTIGMVRGYIRKGIQYNGVEGVFYTIQVNTLKGQSFIQYEIHGPRAQYNTNDLVELKVHGDYFKIVKKL